MNGSWHDLTIFGENYEVEGIPPKTPHAKWVYRHRPLVIKQGGGLVGRDLARFAMDRDERPWTPGPPPSGVWAKPREAPFERTLPSLFAAAELALDALVDGLRNVEVEWDAVMEQPIPAPAIEIRRKVEGIRDAFKAIRR